ncbi:Eco57I restriction-modification methylase domain-containing protein [Horticoccus luteus]|uniref:site-specific DNA-methyltransferase (adenine-specific) n=1 Tax=Horticoccus luteus TaxID=2862869 RepID=A0A8F9TTB5_9BACT|nr:Eco57I restriction-modification methylase domain-containing protein [Horticoccus luteus]QYM78676.1 Eco57I restriction-modification methylase domain-containing protein [Horticoccus luteus]
MIHLLPPPDAGVVYTKPWMVALILDLAGYTADRDLAHMVSVEPSAGDGAFLEEMVRRLVASCRQRGIPLTETGEAIRAFEICSGAVHRAVALVTRTLIELRVPNSLASSLARSWIKESDFLEASLGFPVADFVVGNPPYIRLEEIPPAKAAFYRSFTAMRGRADIYIAFYQAALQQLKPGGVCAFICADRWMLNDYGRGLREFITTQGYNVRIVIEAHNVAAFESEVSAYPAVTVIAREPQRSVIVARALPGIEISARSDLLDQIEKTRSTPVLRVARFADWFHEDEPWPCSSPEALQMLKHLEATCLPLEDRTTGTKIGIGVATGADDVFITKRKPDIEPDRLLPLALAADLKHGRVKWSGHYLVNPWNEHGLVNLADYPRLTAYLQPHQALLSGRHTAKERPQQWHKTIDRVTLARATQEKLYIADIKDRLLPAIDRGETYPQHNLYWITSDKWDLRVLGGLLMSAVGEFFIHCYGVRMRGGFLRFQAQYLRRIRVPNPDHLSVELKRDLRDAFERQDVSLATNAAFKAYGISALPG